MFEVKLNSQPQKFLCKQDKHIYLRLKDGLKKLCEPFKYVEHYEGAYYKFRIGDYRALLDIDLEKQIVWVRVLEHRRKVYK